MKTNGKQQKTAANQTLFCSLDGCAYLIDLAYAAYNYTQTKIASQKLFPKILRNLDSSDAFLLSLSLSCANATTCIVLWNISCTKAVVANCGCLLRTYTLHRKLGARCLQQRCWYQRSCWCVFESFWPRICLGATGHDISR